MQLIKYYVIVSGIFLTTAVTAAAQSPAAGAKDEINAALGISVKPAGQDKATPAPEKPDVRTSDKKAEHKSMSFVRKSHVRKNVEHEPAPGERLTMKHVMELLKTTRNLSGKNLSGLRLTGLDLTKCNLKGADLSNANLERADLEEANLELADLTGANMKMTDLRITGLRGARLDRALLDGAIWRDGTTCAKGSIGACRDGTVSYASQ